MGSYAEQRRFKADSVCIIGAGPSGLAAAKYLVAENTFSRITILEQRATVGGIWNYVPCPDSANRDLQVPQTSPHAGREIATWKKNGGPEYLTPLYDRLETNIPRGLMGFSDLNWPAEAQLFPQHEKVLDYIEKYAEAVKHLIRFQTQVLDVRSMEDDKWKVKTQEVTKDDSGRVEEETFDAVIVASGHFNVPYIPDVPGMKEWNTSHPGSISHAKFYRLPEHFANKKVIVVGNSASGTDIGAQIQPFCKQPLLWSQKSESFLLSDNSASKIDKPPIAEFSVEDRTVRFEDGSVETGVDSILYCTGYFYSFPFLKSLDPPLVTSGERVENTYHHLFYRPHPTLSFPVLNQRVIPFAVAEAQAAVTARVLSGRLTLPSDDEMKKWEEEEMKETGGGRNFHVMKFPKDANYINMLHGWSMSAEDEMKDGSRHIGRPPPYWGEKEYWTRGRFPAIKKAFGDLGDGRHDKRSLEDVGFDFEEWKKQQG